MVRVNKLFNYSIIFAVASVGIFNPLIWGVGFSSSARGILILSWLVPAVLILPMFILLKPVVILPRQGNISTYIFLAMCVIFIFFGVLGAPFNALTFSFFLGDFARIFLALMGYTIATTFINQSSENVDILAKSYLIGSMITVLIGFFSHVYQIITVSEYLRYGHLSMFPIIYFVLKMISFRDFQKKPGYFFLTLFITLVLTIDLFTSLSRAALILMALVLIYVLIVSKITNKIRIILVVTTVILLILPFINYLPENFLEYMFARINGALTSFWGDYSIKGKSFEASNIINYLSTINPFWIIFGSGFGSGYVVTEPVDGHAIGSILHHAHFTPLNIALRSGFLGMGFYIVFALSMAKICLSSSLVALRRPVKYVNGHYRELLMATSSIFFLTELVKSLTIFNFGGLNYGILIAICNSYAKSHNIRIDTEV